MSGCLVGIGGRGLVTRGEGVDGWGSPDDADGTGGVLSGLAPGGGATAGVGTVVGVEGTDGRGVTAGTRG